MACGNCGSASSSGSIVIPTPQQLLKGITSLAHLAISEDNRATEEIIKQRRDKCRDCEFSTKNESRKDRPTKGLTSLSQCKKCACFIRWKTIALNETCPIGLW